jgi:tripartite-type tricarboxylate transporter receptor subunit TctC
MHRTSISRRGFALGAVALAATLAAPLGAQAEAAFPSKPITVIVPFAAGGTTDILARIVGQALGKELGQSVIIENRAGAGGNIGAQVAARAPADGYTLFMGTVGTHAINQSLYRNLPYDATRDSSRSRWWPTRPTSWS